jgi:N-acetylglucosaminyl-diphospho-decaprenol L-rhamnosyltransferase
MAGLSVVIVNWNVRDLLRNCLTSVFNDISAGHLNAEVWVVDNASSDGSVDMLRRDFPQVHMIASEKNLGFAGGNNAALRAMGFGQTPLPDGLPEAVLLLNPDTEVHPGALPTLFNFLCNTPRAGIAAARLVYGDGSFQHSAFDFPGLWQLAIELLPVPGRLVESRLNGRYPRSLYESDTPFTIGHPLGAAMAVRREAIEQVDLLDENYRMYVEEVDWSKRIVAAGWRAYCVPQALITHLGGQSTGQIKTDMFITLWASRYRFYQKHYGLVKLWLARQIVISGMHRQAKQAAAAASRDELSQAELSERLSCYQTVINIWQGKTI